MVEGAYFSGMKQTLSLLAREMSICSRTSCWPMGFKEGFWLDEEPWMFRRAYALDEM